MEATTLYGFSNIDMSKQIIVAEKSVFAGISRANQTISIYHGETLIADCTMPSAGMEDFPTVVLEKLTLHDDTFTEFIDGETYTIVAGGEPSITGFAMNGDLFSFDVSVLWAILHYAGQIVSTNDSESHTNYAISQKITTTKKRYDIKRLPEELLPKTVATKAEVREAQTSAETAQSTSETAQSTATQAQTTATQAQTTATQAQTTANGAVRGIKQGGTMWYHLADAAYETDAVDTLFGYAGEGALIIEVTKGSSTISPTVTFNPPVFGAFNADFSFARVSNAYPHPKITEIGGIVMYASDDASKKFLITVNSSGALSATEVTDAS